MQKTQHHHVFSKGIHLIVDKINKSNKEMNAPVSGTNIGDLSQLSQPNLKKQKCYHNKGNDWEPILE